MFLLLDSPGLERTRQRVASGDARLAPAMERLRAEAEEALRQGPWSVTDKKLAPPGGDRHDYMSVGIYWWPNPDTPDGLPYVWRDGESNPDYFASDGGSLREMTQSVETLSLAHYFTGDERYAAHAGRVLRTWFIDEATRMNPHLRYAQAIPGKTEGRALGLVDVTQKFPNLPDAMAMLRGSTSWGKNDDDAMKAWFTEFLHWTQTDDFGSEESAQRNNHGTWMDIMTSVLALYTDQPEIAERVLRAVPEKILDDQIEPDGKQPHELWRTRSFVYSTFNLYGYFQLATLAERFGLDLWNYQTAQGSSIRKAAEWMAQYAHPDSQWPYQEIDLSTFRTLLYSLLYRAFLKYDDPAFQRALLSVPDEEWRSERFRLLWER